MNNRLAGTFVSIGNAIQPFSRLLDEVALMASDLPQPVIVQHGNTPFQSNTCKALPFVGMNEFERLMGEAELLILHAGAGSVINAVRAGKVPVVMPRRRIYGEHLDDHQIEFVKALETTGKVVVAMEITELCAAVQRSLISQKKGVKSSNESLMLRLVEKMLSGYAIEFS